MIVLLAGSEKELQEIVNRLDRVGNERGLLIKTKTMTLNAKICNIVLKGSILDQVDTFQYLGSLMTEDAECSKDIRGKLAKALSTGAELKQIWRIYNIKLQDKTN